MESSDKTSPVPSVQLLGADGEPVTAPKQSFVHRLDGSDLLVGADGLPVAPAEPVPVPADQVALMGASTAADEVALRQGMDDTAKIVESKKKFQSKVVSIKADPDNLGYIKVTSESGEVVMRPVNDVLRSALKTLQLIETSQYDDNLDHKAWLASESMKAVQQALRILEKEGKLILNGEEMQQIDGFARRLVELEKALKTKGGIYVPGNKLHMLT